MDSLPLFALTEQVARGTTPVFSILVSRNGALVYELYTSSLWREEACYLMSVTKSVTGALVGAAIDRGLIPGPDASVADVLGPAGFPSEADRRRFQGVTVKHVLGMSALDAPVPPHTRAPGAAERLAGFWSAPDRVAFALGQPLLPTPGASFEYTDMTPMIAVGMIVRATGKSALAWAEEALFGPMGFRNHEWMHRDATGHDNGAFGLRLRPIDMQKLGVLYLRRGDWNGRRLLSEAWVDRSLSPWIRSDTTKTEPDYGWYWWARRFGSWTGHVAAGWKGQRIAVFPEKGVVVTMTGCIEGADDENDAFRSLLEDYVIPSVEHGSAPRPADPAWHARLAALLEEVRLGPTRISPDMQHKMVPSVQPKEGPHPVRTR